MHMKLSKLISTSLLFISTLLTGCKPANSEDLPGGTRLDFTASNVKIRFVYQVRDEQPNYLHLDKRDTSASSSRAIFLNPTMRVYVEAIVNQEEISEYHDVEITYKSGKSIPHPSVDISTYYKVAFSYSKLKVFVKEA